MKPSSGLRAVHSVRCASFRRHAVAAAVAAAFGTAAPAWAQLPTGATVVNGAADIATREGQMTVRNTPNAVLNWESFSIGAGNGVHFEQAGATSKVLNRVVGNDPSSILGRLSSNGAVWLLNPNGVLFGENARVDVASLVASTLALSNEDFLAGRHRFDATGLPTASVLNGGEIRTSFGGHAWLLGGTVRNKGLVQSPGGQIVLAAGDSIELVDSGMPRVGVRVSAPANEALNVGSLLAPRGGSIDVHGGIVNQQGIVRADSIGTDPAGRILIRAQGDVNLSAASQVGADAAGGSRGGDVRIESAGGTALVDGSVTATSAGGLGGRLQLLAERIGLVGEAAVDASGASGGGEVLIGGDLQGANPAVPNAQAAFVGPGATIKANATGAGDGGKVVVWANAATRVYGGIEAKGGAAGGDGGFVETSGLYLEAHPKTLDVSAPQGKQGTWLLDPGDIAITDTTATVLSDSATFTSSTDFTTIGAPEISAKLSAGTNVIISTGGGTFPDQDGGFRQGNISVEADISPGDADEPGSLTLRAHNDIILREDVQIASIGGPMGVTLVADLDGVDGGGLTLEPGSEILSAGGDIRLNGGRVLIQDPGDNFFQQLPTRRISIQGASLNSEQGVIDLHADTIELDNATLSSSNSEDAIVIKTGTFSNNGSELQPGPGRWLIELDGGFDQLAQTTFGGISYDFIQVGGDSGFMENNIDNGVVLGNGLEMRITLNATRFYDGTTTATFTDALVNSWPNDLVLTPSSNGVPVRGTFDNRNVGQAKSISYTINGNRADFFEVSRNGIPVYGVDQVYLGEITRREVGYAIAASDKDYDGNRTAQVRGSVPGLLAGDNVALTGLNGLFDTKDVGTRKTVTVTGAALTGTDAGNYTLTGPTTTTADITQLEVNYTLSAANKVYDATRTAPISGVVSGLLAGDDVSFAVFTGLFDTKTVGTGKTVTVTGAALAGADAGNYSLTGPTTTTADITPRPVGFDISAANKVYDGTRAATVSYNLPGLLAGDDISVTGLSGLFDTKNAGTGKTVTVSGGVLTGADAANYTLSASATTIADITPRPTTANITGADKVYDGTRRAWISFGAFPSVLPGDFVTIGTSEILFEDKNVGADKLITFTPSIMTGADAPNYVLTGPLTTRASITPRPLEIGIAGQVSKEYDATTGASLAGVQYILNGAIANDALTVAGPAVGSYDSANVGQQKRVSVSGFTVAGADAPNYSVGGVRLASTASNPVEVTAGADIGTITPATLTYRATPAVREAGQAGAPLDGTVTGFKGGDSLATATSGNLLWTSGAAPQAAPGSYAIEGGGLLAANYLFVQAPENAAALVVRQTVFPTAAVQTANASGNTAIESAVQSAQILPDTAGEASGLLDASSPAATRGFKAVRIGAMGQDELRRMLDERRDFKKKLFANAVHKLELDPSLADLRPCTTVVEASSGACRITAAQLDLMHAAKKGAPAPARKVLAKTATLPQIERKIALLVGINEYADKTIPQLENAIPDVDAIGRLFAEKLGYEVRILRNPDKAEIVRSLNALSTEIDGSDSVVVYYAGHGYSLEKDGAGYWLPSDASASDPRQWISNSDIAQLLSNVRSKQLALISDSCYSGAFAREGMEAVGRNVSADDVLAKRSVVVLSSGGDEPVADEGKGNHSIFAWNLMQVVGGVANWKPGSTVFDDVQAGVRKEFPQTPKYGSVTAAGHQRGGDYLFELR